MPIEYVLRMVADQTPDQVKARVGAAPQFVRDYESVWAPGINCVSAIRENSLGQSLIKEAFDFVPTLAINFQLDKFDQTELGMDLMLEAVQSILEQLSGDAVLLHNNEDVIAIRKDGRLVINSDSDFWSPSRLKRLRLPYERQPVPPMT